MFELVFVFTGLCGYALDPPMSAGEAEGFDVVLAQAHDHVQQLVVATERIHPGGTTVECTELRIDGFCAVDLERKIVRLREPQPGKITWDPLAEDKECPDQNDAHSYGWAVPMSEVTPGEGLVLHELRSPSREPPEPFGAVIQLESGHLRNARFSRDWEDRIIRWRFSRGPWRCRIRRALSDVVVLRQEGWDRNVVIEIVDVESRAVELLELTPPLPCLGDPSSPGLLVEIFNTPPEDICAGAPYEPAVATPATARSEEVNHHFTHLYRLLPDDSVVSTPKADGDDVCPNPPPDPGVGVRCAVSCFDPQTAPGNPYCPGADVSGP